MSAGPLFKFTPAVSLLVAFRTKGDVDALWNALSAGRHANDRSVRRRDQADGNRHHRSDLDRDLANLRLHDVLARERRRAARLRSEVGERANQVRLAPLASCLPTQIDNRRSAFAEQSYSLARAAHDDVDHARDRILAIVKAARISVLADLAYRGYLRSSARSCGASGIHRVAARACTAVMRPAARLLLRAGCERYRAAAAPRPFETGNGCLLGGLRIAGMRQPNQRKRRDESECCTPSCLVMGRVARTVSQHVESPAEPSNRGNI
jgi:3-demethylubiquinone-9 3-methyltransferase